MVYLVLLFCLNRVFRCGKNTAYGGSVNVRALAIGDLTELRNTMVCMFFFALSFGLAIPAAVAGQWGVVDEKCRTIIPSGYDWIHFTKQRQFEMCDAGDKARVYADLNGNIVPRVHTSAPDSALPFPTKAADPSLPLGFSAIQREDGFIVASGPDGCGVFLHNGKQLVAPIYSKYDIWVKRCLS